MLLECLKRIAPGTELRLGMEYILQAKTGGLIVIGDSEEVLIIPVVHHRGSADSQWDDRPGLTYLEKMGVSSVHFYKSYAAGWHLRCPELDKKNNPDYIGSFE